MPSFNKQFPITTSDTLNFPFIVSPGGSPGIPHACQAIYVGGAGNVVAVMEDNTTVTLKSAPAGAYLVGKFIRVNTTNTTATDLVACYSV